METGKIDINKLIPSDLLEKPNVHIRYDEMIQSFDFGLIYMISVFYSDKRLPFRFIDDIILKNITYESIKSRKIYDIWEWLLKLHQDTNVKTQYIEDVLHECKTTMNKILQNDDYLISCSPKLILYKILAELQLTDTIRSINFYIDDKFLINGNTDPIMDMLLEIYSPTKICPVGVDVYSGDFVKHVKAYTEKDPVIIIGSYDYRDVVKLLEYEKINILYPDNFITTMGRESRIRDISLVAADIQFIKYENTIIAR